MEEGRISTRAQGTGRTRRPSISFEGACPSHGGFLAALCAGADCAVAVLALRAIAAAPAVRLIFKDARMEFVKRAEGDVHFTCEEGRAIRDLLERAERTGGRETSSLRVVATVPRKLGEEPVAVFEMTLSARRRKGA